MQEQSDYAFDLREKADNSIELEKIYPDCRHWVYRLCLRMSGNEEDARDLCQEVFIRVYQKRDSFKGASSLHTWIYRITFNICIDFHRHRQRRQPKEELFYKNYMTPGRDFGDGNCDGVVAIAKYRQRLATATPLERRVLELFVEDGYNVCEIAGILGLSSTAVSCRLQGSPFPGRSRLSMVAEKSSGNYKG